LAKTEAEYETVDDVDVAGIIDETTLWYIEECFTENYYNVFN
jgi:hypothetical protein